MPTFPRRSFLMPKADAEVRNFNRADAEVRVSGLQADADAHPPRSDADQRAEPAW